MLSGGAIFTTAVFSIVFLGKKFEYKQLYAMCMVVSGIFIVGFSNYIEKDTK